MPAAVRVFPGRVWKLCRGWAAIMLLALLFQAPAAFADDAADANAAKNAKPDPRPNFEFVDGAAVTLSPDASVGFKFDLLIKNSGDKAGEPWLALLSGMESKCHPQNLAAEPRQKPNEPKTAEEAKKPRVLATIEPKGVIIAHVTVSGIELPATCYLQLTAGDPAGKDAGNTSLKQIKLSQQYLTKDFYCPLYICFWLAGLVGLVTGICVWRRIKDKNGKPVGPLYKVGTPTWELDKSWISNTTVVSSVIATAMALGALPELTTYASKTGYATLAFVTALAVIVAPFLFTAFRVGEAKQDGGVDYGTCLWLFLLSGAITLFAGMAQVVLLFLLFDEIFLAYHFWSLGSAHEPWAWPNLGFISTIVLVAALCWYVGHSMFMTIKQQANPPKPKPAGRQEFDAPAGPASRPSWTVF
jgi:hypothetical protein